jgi:hypothetical protein
MKRAHLQANETCAAYRVARLGQGGNGTNLYKAETHVGHFAHQFAFLSKPAARPTGFLNFKPSTSRSSR